MAGQPLPQSLRQLPCYRLSPGLVFDKVGVDYTWPILVKSGPICRPLITKVYMCVFISFTVNAICLHVEVVSELTTAAFIACLCTVYSSMRETDDNLEQPRYKLYGSSLRTERPLHIPRECPDRLAIVKFCSDHCIQWSFSPEFALHFGGLW